MKVTFHYDPSPNFGITILFLHKTNNERWSKLTISYVPRPFLSSLLNVKPYPGSPEFIGVMDIERPSSDFGSLCFVLT